MITLRHDNLPPIAVVGRAEELIARIVARADAINSMHYGSVELHFGQGGRAVLWLKDCIDDKEAHPN